MRFLARGGSLYYTAGPVFHKCLETGFERLRKNDGFSICWRFNTRGDHAGLKFYVEVFGFFFEFNIYDHRHWSWEKNRWLEHGEYEEE